MKQIKGPLPILHEKWWSDGYHFWIQMMEICLPFLFTSRCIWWGDSNHSNAFPNQNEKGPLPILNDMWWRDAYHFSMEMMEICLPFLFDVGIFPSFLLKNGRHPSSIFYEELVGVPLSSQFKNGLAWNGGYPSIICPEKLKGIVCIHPSCTLKKSRHPVIIVYEGLVVVPLSFSFRNEMASWVSFHHIYKEMERNGIHIFIMSIEKW